MLHNSHLCSCWSCCGVLRWSGHLWMSVVHDLHCRWSNLSWLWHDIRGQESCLPGGGLNLTQPASTGGAPRQRMPRKCKVLCFQFITHLRCRSGPEFRQECQKCWTLFVSSLCALKSSIVVGRIAGGAVSDRDRPGLGERECRSVSQAAASTGAQGEEGKQVESSCSYIRGWP